MKSRKYTKELLTQMYIVEQKPIYTIARELKGNPGAVHAALHRHGISVRPVGNTHAEGRKYFISKEDLEREYTDNGKTQHEIAEMYGCGDTLIFNAMKDYNIPVRPRPEHLKGRKQSLAHRTNNAVSHIGKSAGDANANWKGGISVDHTAIRNRKEHTNWRNFILRIKGDTCEQCGKDLNAVCDCCSHKPDKHVHHIKDFASHPELRSDPSNGLVLCDVCHKKLHTRKGTIT